MNARVISTSFRFDSLVLTMHDYINPNYFEPSLFGA